MRIFDRLFGAATRNVSTSSFYQSLYPEEVRYALSYKGAKMGKSEIQALVARFPTEALYLVTKAYADDRETLQAYLEELTRLFVYPDFSGDDLRAILQRYLDLLPSETVVSGAKLSQLSRSGTATWQQAFRNIAQKCYTLDASALPCLIAWTTMIGYRHFVEIYSQRKHGRITLLVPGWLLDPNEQIMGYEVILEPAPTVILQQKNMCLFGNWACKQAECLFQHRYCGNTFFIDDTIHTGATARKIESFWHSQYGLQISMERVHVITDLRS